MDPSAKRATPNGMTAFSSSPNNVSWCGCANASHLAALPHRSAGAPDEFTRFATAHLCRQGGCGRLVGHLTTVPGDSEKKDQPLSGQRSLSAGATGFCVSWGLSIRSEKEINPSASNSPSGEPKEEPHSSPEVRGEWAR